MIEWEDRAILLGARAHGEDAAILSLLTLTRGRHAGLVRGARGRRLRGALEPGTVVDVHWKARLEDHLGTLSLEPLASVAGGLMGDRDRLAALSAACALAEAVLPEREPHGPLFQGLLSLIDALAHEPERLVWAGAYARWELALLTEMGFGLDLSCCAATGVTEDLTHVSPRSGRAVSRAAAQPYLNRLLPLPAFLPDPDPEARPAGAGEVAAATRLTGHFLDAHLLHPHGRRIPAARQRFLDRLALWDTICGDP